MKFVTVGDNCIDWYYLQKEAHVGGCSVNAAVYITQLGEDASYIGVVGNDENGILIREELKNRGVDVSHLHVKSGTTAVTKIKLVENDRTFCGYHEGVLSRKYLTAQDLEFIRTRDYMHTSVYGNCQDILGVVKEDVVLVYDFAYKLEHESIPDVLKHIHYGFFSYEKDDEFIRDYLKEKWNQGEGQLKLLAATLGKYGSLSYDGKDFYRHKIRAQKPVDTMGAGDSFISGFMVALSKGLDHKTCMEKGSELASKVIMCKGAF